MAADGKVGHLRGPVPLQGGLGAHLGLVEGLVCAVDLPEEGRREAEQEAQLYHPEAREAATSRRRR